VHEFAYRGSRLMVEKLPLTTVAERFGTPLYIYSKHSVIDHCRHLERAFAGEPHQTSYAVKANSNRALLAIIAGEGLGADVGSKGELYLARAAGFPAGRITYSGVGKRDDEIAYALDEGIAGFNVESREEISAISRIAASKGMKAAILLRVNLNIDAGGHAYISTSLKRSKFGIDWHEARGVLEWAATLEGIEIRGIHSHIGSQIVKSETFIAAAKILVDLVRELRGNGIAITDLDFGGGYGVQYRGYVADPQLPAEEPEAPNLSAATLVQTVLPVLRGSGCHLSIQPGRSIVAHSGALAVRVIFRKESGERTFIIVDGGMNDLIRPSLYNAYHQIVPLELTAAPHETVDVVGPLCESGDFLAQERRLARVDRGERLAVMCAGAYGYVLSSNYNARPRPAEVLVDGDSVTVVRERESLQDL
jgi:diaminopimelate decarboxylase